jgi:hypothetical protein
VSKEVKKEDLVGAWRYETRYIEFADGHRENQYGEHPQALIIILPNGWYSHILMRNDLPRYSSGVMEKATDQEAQAVVTGALPDMGPFWRYSGFDPLRTSARPDIPHCSKALTWC